MRCLLVLVLLASTAYAQAPDETPELKSKTTAAVLSWGTTAVSIFAILAIPDDPTTKVDDVFGLTAASLFVLGPSAGHWYVGEGLTTGLALRLTGAAIFTGLVLGDPEERSRASGELTAGAIGAMLLVSVGAGWDLATVNRAVADHNARQLQLAPMVTSHGGTGLSLAGTF
jgi:hypothetical protein